MSTPYVGEIRIFAGTFAPAGWAFCEGQLLSIAENEVLFTLIGTTYGGDGQSTFALPDLRGRLPVHMGTGPGLSAYTIGESGGVETVTLAVSQLPTHTHAFVASPQPATETLPQGQIPGEAQVDIYNDDASIVVPMHPQAVSLAGGSTPHANIMPFLCVNFIISLFGIFPSQS